MSSESRPLEILPRQHGGQELQRFDQRSAAPFVNKSISPETRRLYHRVIREFFHFVGSKSEIQVTQQDVLRWRDSMMRDGR